MAVPIVVDYDVLAGEELRRFNEIANFIKSADEVIVFEGLPPEYFPAEFKQEVATKQTIRLHGFAFYSRPLSIMSSDFAPLRAASTKAAHFGFSKMRGIKGCGGFHPDFLVRWKRGKEAIDLMLCFTCGDARFAGTARDLWLDLQGTGATKLGDLLWWYQDQRPKRRTSR